MSNKNTVVRAVRIDSSLDKSITATASEKGLSFNLLANQILTKYSEFDRVAEKLGFIGVTASNLKDLFSLISNEEAERLGARSSFSGDNARQVSTMLVGRGDLEGFLEMLKLMEKYIHAFSIEISHVDREIMVIMSHTLGIKWSYFLKGMLSEALQGAYGVKPDFEITENFITTRFTSPENVVAASHA